MQQSWRYIELNTCLPNAGGEAAAAHTKQLHVLTTLLLHAVQQPQRAAPVAACLAHPGAHLQPAAVSFNNFCPRCLSFPDLQQALLQHDTYEMRDTPQYSSPRQHMYDT